MTTIASDSSPNRIEQRVPMAVAVHLSGHEQIPGVETTFTQNVSSRGARVVYSRRWQAGDRLAIALLPGDFRANARVAYCMPINGEGFAIGLEFLEPVGRWVLSPARGSENNLHG
ncbi:MAG TPA: PilZ domain-containing protein [Candidatus Acidoferrales bacterium]